MQRSTVLILSAISIGLILGLAMEPAITVIIGAVLWLSILFITGGAEDGNPYRTMKSTPVPDIFEVGRFMKQQKVAKERPPQTLMIWLLFGAGALLMALGLLWMHLLGQI